LTCLLVAVVLIPVKSSQETVMPVIVSGPVFSATEFTNWEVIDLTYTFRYMDGYEPVWNELMPHEMNFGVLELDPQFSEKLDTRNKGRRFQKENYFDIVYHLRYMDANKDELIIPSQRFAYRKVQAGDDKVEYFTTKEFILAYRTVLTSDADDIIEHYDQGSFQKLATTWKTVTLVVIPVLALGSLLLIFWTPVTVPLLRGADGQVISSISPKVLNLDSLITELLHNLAKRNLGPVCDGLTDLIRAYVPAVKIGTFSKEMIAPITAVPHEWERERLLRVNKSIRDIEDYLFAEMKSPAPSLEGLAVTLEELRPAVIYRRRHMFNLRNRPANFFLWCKEKIRRRKS